MLENIELNVNKAQNYVQKGEKKLTKAKEDHKSARKKMCFILVIALVVLAVIIGPTLGTKLWRTYSIYKIIICIWIIVFMAKN